MKPDKKTDATSQQGKRFSSPFDVVDLNIIRNLNQKFQNKLELPSHPFLFICTLKKKAF